MRAIRAGEDEVLRRFLRRVWREDIAPLLRGQRAGQRRRSARIVGTMAATTGLALDGLLRLKGKPFTRALTVLGSTFGALLPDAWDWGWLRRRAGPRERKVVAQQVERRAGKLPLEDALGLFHLKPGASREQLKHAWHQVAQRWHPDKAPDDARRAEYHVRFVAYQAAYERLRQTYGQPRPTGDE